VWLKDSKYITPKTLHSLKCAYVFLVPTPNLWTAVVVGVAVGVFLGICLLFLLHCLLQNRCVVYSHFYVWIKANFSSLYVHTTYNNDNNNNIIHAVP